jgi:hypothetical protein
VATLAADALRPADAGEISILDVGGASGVYSAIWLTLNPAARSTQLDWGPINAIARRLLTERGVVDRFTSIDGDPHTTDFGDAAYDVAVYSRSRRSTAERRSCGRSPYTRTPSRGTGPHTRSTSGWETCGPCAT